MLSTLVILGLLLFSCMAGDCDLPPMSSSFTLTSNKIPLTVRLLGAPGTDSYAPGTIVSVDIEQLRKVQTKIAHFIFWVETGRRERVGKWSCCYEVAPFIELAPECNSTITSGAKISSAGFYANDIRLTWRAPENLYSSLTLRGLVVVRENGDNLVGYSVSRTISGSPKITRKRPEEFESAAEPQFKRTAEQVRCTSANGFPASPITLKPFTRRFSVPPTAKPNIATRCDNETRCFVYYEITAKIITQQLFPGNATRFYSYGQDSTGIFTVPGPTIKNCRGQQTIVRFINRIPNPNGTARAIAVHLHGSASFAPYDGWADDIIMTSQFKDYVYPNNRAATLWYHDHAFGITAQNAYRGLFAQYWVDNCCVNYSGYIPLPPYDVPFIVGDVVFDKNNQLLFDQFGAHSDDLYGDHILVNGVPWPSFPVENRKYRFRILVADPSRQYRFRFSNNMTFWIIAADGGFLQQPRPVKSYFHAQGERYEIIVDFSRLKGQTLYLMNDDDIAPQFCQTHFVAQFVVNQTFKTSVPDATLWTSTNFPTMGLLPGGAVPLAGIIPDRVRNAAAALARPDRTAAFVRNNGQWKIDVYPPITQIVQSGLSGEPLTWEETFNLPQPHVVMNPNSNVFELWEFENGGGGWVHPVHTHLIDAIITNRTTFFPTQEILAAKDVFYLPGGGKARVISRVGPHAGSFMMHCHNLVHEDDDMLLAFGVQDNVTVPTQIFRDGSFLHIPLSPRANYTDFKNSLRNPMYAPTFASNTPLTNASRVIDQQLLLLVYNVFYPSASDPIRRNSTGGFPPLGNNPLNPWEVDYKCWRQPPVRFSPVFNVPTPPPPKGQF